MLLNLISDQSKTGAKQQTGVDPSPRQGFLLLRAGEGERGSKGLGKAVGGAHLHRGKVSRGSKRARAGQVIPTANSGKAAGLGQNLPARLLTHKAALLPLPLQSSQQPLSKTGEVLRNK